MINKVFGTKTLAKDPKVIEHSISINQFNQPLVYTNEDATAIKLIELILLRPGTYPTRPKMGVGLVERYRYTFFEHLYELEEDITNQIRTYLPEFESVDVNLTKDELNKTLFITISLDSVAYSLVFNSQTNTISVI